MSSNTRATSKGGKGKPDKSHKSDKSESGKGGSDKQHKDGNFKNEDLSMKEKVKMLIEMTHRTEDEVCLALHDCDNDVAMATNLLFDSESTGEWETRVKKKKKQPAAANNKQDGGKPDENAPPLEEWNDNAPVQATGGGNGTQSGGNDRRNRTNGPPRLHGGRGGNDGGSRGWRGRERHENERNLEEGGGGYRGRGGRIGGAGRGGGGRGRGGGRAGGGRYQPRGNRASVYNKPIDTWDNNSTTWDNNTALNSNHNPEDIWEDFPSADEWSTEEYQGSLAETKVFTPSIQTVPESASISEPSGMTEQMLLESQQLVPQPQPPASQSPVPQMVGTLTAAQTQYFSQLQQNNDPLTKQYSPQTQSYQSQTYEKPASVPTVAPQYVAATAQAFQSPYVDSGTATTVYQQPYSSTANQEQVVAPQQPPQVTTQQRTKTQRARVPPPSKIPSSAVEMPGDLNSSIGYLDVQFGAMDLIDGNTSFDNSIDSKYTSNNLETTPGSTGSGIDLNSAGQNGATLDSYSPKGSMPVSGISSLSQSLSNVESMASSASDHLSNSYSSSTNRNPAAVPSTVSSVVSSTPLELSKQSQQESHSFSQPSTYNSYQSKTSGYSSNYSSGAQTTASSYVSNQAANYSQSSGGYSSTGGNSYQNTYSSNNSYQAGGVASTTGFASMSQANAYPSNNQSYPQNPSQSVYGANTGLSNSTNYNASSGQYNNYSGAQHKLGKDGTYDSSSTTNSGQTTTTVSSASLSLSQTTSGSSKASTTLAKNSNSMVSNIPPGVTPVMSTPYIQVPYFQPPVYSYEDVQMLQQRLPHITTPYYDMYQSTPTTIATVREGTLGNVGYPMGGDARYAAAAVAAAGRTDNSASPSPSSTLSVGGQGGTAGLSSSQGQQQVAAAAVAAAQQQPLMAGAAPAPYFFATAAAFNALAAPNYQFGTMYTQLPTATNAHGSSNSTQYPKPAGYGAGYGGYDALGPAQDYTKGGYVGAAGQGQKGGVNTTSAAGGSASAANDLSTMYAKSHTALGKVNSYEKQGFHSGTPPPFTGALHGSQNAGLAPSAAGYPQVYIPAMATQHHSTHMMQQPLHQDSANTGGQRSQASNQSKAGAKQTYQASYWNQA